MRKKGAARAGQNARARHGTEQTRTRAAALVSARNDTAKRATRQELARLGANAQHIARRCPTPRQSAKFSKLARFLLRASRGGRAQ